MKNSTLIRIKVPKALYESALRKALLEVAGKEPKAGHKGNKFAKEDDYSKKAKTQKPTAMHADKESNKGGGAHKGKAFVKDDAYTDKLTSKKSDMKLTSNKPLAETKKKMKEADEIEKFRTLTPNREIVKDANRMQERKRKVEEKKKMEERKHKIKETKKHDDTAEDTKLIKKLVAPSALKAAGSKHPDEKADVTLMHKKLKPSAFKGSK
jgi:hypothetical protein